MGTILCYLKDIPSSHLQMTELYGRISGANHTVRSYMGEYLCSGWCGTNMDLEQSHGCCYASNITTHCLLWV